jgi:hypothetical protein
MLLIPEFSSKAKLLSMRPELLVTLMSDAVMQTLKKHAATVLSDRTPNQKIKLILKDEFREAYYGFAKVHPTYASDTLRTLYIEHLSEQRDRLDGEVQEFTLGLEPLEKPALPHHNYAAETLAKQYPNLAMPAAANNNSSTAADRFAQTGERGRRYKDSIEYYEKLGEPDVELCPYCKKPGLRTVTKKNNRWSENMRHTYFAANANKTKATYHLIKVLDEDTARMRQAELKSLRKGNGRIFRKPLEEKDTFTCTTCKKPGRLSERVIRNLKQNTYKHVRLVTHGLRRTGDLQAHIIKVLEERPLTEQERAEVATNNRGAPGKPRKSARTQATPAAATAAAA